MRIQGKSVNDGYVEGRALVLEEPKPLSRLINPETGIIEEGRNKGESVAGRVLVYRPHLVPPYDPSVRCEANFGQGFTLYGTVECKKAPCGVIIPDGIKKTPIGLVTATEVILSKIPTIVAPDIDKINNGNYLMLYATEGIAEISDRRN